MPLSNHSTPLYAAVELGSDSFRLHVASWENGALLVAASLNEPIRLGAGIGPDGCLDGQTVRRALACLRQFRLALAVWEVRAVRVVATAALRVACNAPAFLPAAESAIGHPVEVLGAEEEGRLVYLGVAGVLGDERERRLVLDVGSGSTGIALGCGDTVERVQSYGVGALRQGLAFFRDGITPAAFEAALASSRSRFADAAALAGPGGWRRAYGASGTVRALFELAGAQAGGRSQGESGASAAGLLALRHSLVEEGGFMQIAALSNAPGRAAQMAGGLALLLALVEILGVEELVPVGAGLRAGVIRELAQRAQACASSRAPYPECA
jgi:exopolyphosphatase/pppGpp-phosphohydrolase